MDDIYTELNNVIKKSDLETKELWRIAKSISSEIMDLPIRNRILEANDLALKCSIDVISNNLKISKEEHLLLALMTISLILNRSKDEIMASVYLNPSDVETLISEANETN